jgi:hypothetical protein
MAFRRSEGVTFRGLAVRIDSVQSMGVSLFMTEQVSQFTDSEARALLGGGSSIVPCAVGPSTTEVRNESDWASANSDRR